VATKRDRSSMPVGIAERGCCESVLVGTCVVSVFPRGTAVVELIRISNVLSPPTKPFLLATHCSLVPTNRGWSMVATCKWYDLARWISR
jgi:hypothetical protein